MNTVVLFIICALVWGSTWFAITFQLGVSCLWSVFYRFLLASIMLGVYCYLRYGFPRFTVRQHFRLFFQGICLCGVSYWLVYESERHITSGLTAVLSTSILYFNVIIRRLWLLKPVETKVICGGILGSIGVLLVMLPEISFANFGSTYAEGMLLALGGTLALSIGCVACEQNEQEKLPMLSSVTFNMIYGCVTVLTIALLLGVKPEFSTNPEFIGSLVYLAIFGSIGALTSYIALIRRIGADRAAFVDIVYPVIALCLSALLEDYHWNLMAMAGIVFIAAGNIVALKPVKVSPQIRLP